MSGRKESLKKSLGISEYPWSSDDEDNTSSQPVQDIHVTRLPSVESQPSVADMPGTSGVQQPPSSPATARKQQAKIDRALFWSFINNTSRSSNVETNRSRACDVPLCVSRPVINVRSSEAREARRNERPSTSTDIQHFLAFKKLTRSLNNLSQRRHNSNLYSTSSRTGAGGSDSPTRSPLFTPSTSTTNTRTRSNNNLSRSQSSRNSLPAYTRNTNPPDVLPLAEPQPAPSRYSLPPRPNAPSDIDTSPPVPEDNHYVVDNSDDEVDQVQETVSVDEQMEENNAEEENAQGQNASDGTIDLEAEIVEVDTTDEPDTNPPVDETDNPEANDTNAILTVRTRMTMSVGHPASPLTATPNGLEWVTESQNVHARSATAEVAANSDENVEAPLPQPPFQGVKRKRETSDENAEPYSVQEFNQSLLRLLECPVCLEWMEPPISQCRRGHLVCSRCRTRLASCPVCRTTFSSVRNRAMEGVAEMLRYPCRHGCGREVRLRRRAPHEASCGARRYHCPAPPCARLPPLAHQELAHHFQCKHLPILKIGRKHKFSMKVNSEQHDTWLIMALDEYFHLRVDVDIRTWGVIVYVAYIGPKRKAKHFTYEVTVEGQHNSRCLKYARATHSDLESSSLNVSRQDCFHLTLDQALNFLRFKNRHCEPDKFLDFDVEITKCTNVNISEPKDESDS